MKIYIRTVDFNDSLQIYLVEDNFPGGRKMIVKPMHMELEELVPGHHAEPSLTLAGTMALEFTKAMAEALDRAGVKTEKDAKIEGTLEATRYHLEDLRRLLKMK